MKKIIHFIAITLIVSNTFSQSPCTDETLMAEKGVWKKRTDASMGVENKTTVIAHIDAMIELFQTAYPEPKGMSPGWYRTMSGNTLVKNGPQPYECISMYLAWYCDNYQHKTVLGGETGTWAYAFVNHFSWFLSSQYDLLSTKLNSRNMFLLPVIKGVWKGYPLYQAYAHGEKGRCIILTHNGQFPWKTVTEQQYLGAIRSRQEEQRKKTDDGYTQHINNLKKGIDDIKNNKSLKQSDRDVIVTNLQRDLDNSLQTKDANMAKSNKYWSDKLNLIDQYTRENADQLQQPAIVESRYQDDFNGFFSTVEKGGQQVVTIDPSYFNMQLPHYAAQFIVLYWRWDTNAPGLNFKKEFEANFPVEKLQSMIDK